MGKKRKVAGEEGELAKEAAAPKVTNLNADAKEAAAPKVTNLNADAEGFPDSWNQSPVLPRLQSRRRRG